MNEYGMNEFEMVKKADVMRIINAENAVVLNNRKERSTDEVLCEIASQINGLQTTALQRTDGRWIDAHFVSGRDFYRCSECGTYIEKPYFANDYNVRYCPNCGARMDGGADNDSK